MLPNLNVEELVKSFTIQTNDNLMVIYLSSLIRSVIALHNLINNKLVNKEHERGDVSGKEKKEKGGEKTKEKAKEKEDGKEDEKAKDGQEKKA